MTSTPQFTISGLKKDINNLTYVGLTGEIDVHNRVDSPGGVGYSRTICDTGSGIYQSILSNGRITVYGTSGIEQNRTIHCKNIDLLGNEGPVGNISIIHDGIVPVVSTTRTNGDYLLVNSSISFSCSDKSTSKTDQIEYQISNSTASVQAIVVLNGTQASLNNLPLNGTSNIWIKYYCADYFGNVGNKNVTGITYLVDSPFVNVSYVGNTYTSSSGIKYITRDTSLIFGYVSNQNGNGSVNLTLRKGGLNVSNWNTSSSKEISLTNYSDGSYVLEFTICSQYYCVNTTENVVIDSVGPSGGLVIEQYNSTIIQRNGTLHIGKSTPLLFRGGMDSISGLKNINCASNYSNFTHDYDGSLNFNPYLSAITLHNSTANIACRIFDNLDTPSDYFNFTFITDFVDPIPTINSSTEGMNVFVDTMFIFRCYDQSSIESAYLKIFKNGSIIINQTVSLSTPIQIDSIYKPTETEGIQLSLICIDSSNNRVASGNLSLRYIPHFEEIIVSKQNIISHANITLVGNNTTIKLEPGTSIGQITIQANSNNTLLWENNYSFNVPLVINSTTLRNMFSSLPTNSTVSIIAIQSAINTSTNKSLILGDFIMTNAPTLSHIGPSLISNNTMVEMYTQLWPCTYTNTMVKLSSNGVWTSYNHTSRLEVLMAASNSSTEILELLTEDCLGNQRYQNITIQRDLISPQIFVTGIHNGVASKSRLLVLNGSDNSEITTFNVTISNGTNTVNICTDTCGVLIDDELSFQHGDLGYLTISLETSSGEVIFLNQSFVVDHAMNPPILSTSNSFNLSGDKIGPNSRIVFTTDEISNTICASIASTNVSTCVTDIGILEFNLPQLSGDFNLTILLNSTDLHGNSAVASYNFSYISTVPVLDQSTYILSSPGNVQIHVNSSVNYTISIPNQISNNSHLAFSSQGDHNFSITMIDEVGNVKQENLRIILDTTGPIVHSNLATHYLHGPSTQFWINATEQTSVIKSKRIYVQEQSNLCEYQVGLNNYSNNLTISMYDFFSESTCNIGTNISGVFEVVIQSTNIANHTTELRYNITYYGSMTPGYITGQNISSIGNNTILVSEHSELNCVSNHGATYTSNMTFVSGNYTVLGSTVNWTNGTTSMSCEASDSLGNTWQGTWNLDYMQNDINIDYEILNNSNLITKLGVVNLWFNATSTTEIIDIDVYLDGIVYQSIEETTSMVQFNTTSGIHQISVRVLNKLGYTSIVIENLTFDAEPFRISIIDEIDYDITGQDQIISMTKDILVQFELSDNKCGNNMSLSFINASLSSYYSNGVIAYVAANQSNFEIEVIDCVGWRSTKQVSIQRKDIISQETYSNQDQIVIPGQGSTSGINSSFEIQVIDSLNVTVTCQTTKGQISCEKLANNSWQIRIQNLTSSGVITLNFNDSIGNSRQTTHNIFSDATAPSCELNSSEINFIHYVKDRRSVELHCNDTQSHINEIRLDNGFSVLQFYQQNQIVFDKNMSQYWNITVYDSVGNNQTYYYQILEDKGSPQAVCQYQSKNISTNDTIYTNTSGIIYCSIIDDVQILGSYRVISSGLQPTVIASFNSSDKLVQIGILSLLDGDEITVDILIRDEFGFEELQEYRIIFDKQTPQLFFQTKNSRNENIQSPLFIDNNGSMQITTYDTNNEILEGQIVCEGQIIVNFNSVSTFELNLKDYDISMCTKTIQMDVTATDKAGNSVFVQQTIDIDFDEPEIHLTSSCYLDSSQSRIVVIPSCTVQFTITDDSRLNKALLIQADDNVSYAAIDTTILTFNDIFNGKTEMRLFVTGTDIVNNSVTENFLFIDQRAIGVEINSQTCNRDEVRCRANETLGYDVLIMGETEINISISSGFEAIPFVETQGTVCKLNSDSECFNINQFPYNTSTLDDGYWIFQFSATDALGRTYSTNQVLLIDIEQISILSDEQFASNTRLNSSVTSLCEACLTMIKLSEHHRPDIQTNVKDEYWSIVQNQHNQWILTLYTNSDSIPLGDSKLFVDVMSQNGDKTKIERTLENINQIFVLPKLTDDLECNDSPSSFIDGELSQYICAFTNDKSGIVEFGIEITNPNPVSITVNATECFLTIGCQTSQHRFNQNVSTFEFQLAVLKDENNLLMEYIFELHTPYQYEPLNFTVEFIDKDSFTTLIDYVEDETRYINVTEQGQVTITTSFLIKTSLGNGKELRNEEYMTMLKYSLEESVCRIKGNRMVPTSTQEINYESKFIDSAFKNCELSVEIDGNRLNLYSNLDWSEELAHGNLLGNGLPFYLMNTESYEIQFQMPISNNIEKRILRKTDEQVEINLIPNRDSEPIFSEKCEAFNKNERSIQVAVDDSELRSCFESLIDNDGLEYVGLIVDFTQFNVSTICPVKKIETWGVLEWLDDKKRSNDGCIVSGGFDQIKFEENYDEITIHVITCDLRCSDDKGFDAFARVLDGSEEWQNVHVKQIEGNEDAWSLTKSIFNWLIISLIGFWGFRRFQTLISK